MPFPDDYRVPQIEVGGSRKIWEGGAAYNGGACTSNCTFTVVRADGSPMTLPEAKRVAALVRLETERVLLSCPAVPRVANPEEHARILKETADRVQAELQRFGIAVKEANVGNTDQ